MIARAAAVLFAAYAIGSIPTGYWFGRAWKGIDVRRHGSGNLGATNVFRVLGAGPGLFTLGFDILKGLLPVLGCQQWFPGDTALAAGTGIAAILGHTTSVFVGFRGGKGVATSAGVFAALLPKPFFGAIGVFAASFALTRIVSISSILGAVTLAVLAFLWSPSQGLSVLAALVAVFILWKHHANLRRLKEGTEPRIVFGKEKA